MRFVGIAAAHVAFVGFLLGLLLRLTARDSVDSFAVLFYATPWPVLSVLPLGEAAVWFARKRRSVAALLLALSAGCIAIWLTQSYFPPRAAQQPSDLRVLFWNAEHPKKRLPTVIAKVSSANADLIGIAETEATKPADKQRWKNTFPTYSIHNLAGGLLFLSRSKSNLIESGPLGLGGDYHVLKTRVHGTDTIVIFANLSAAPFRSRRPAFERLNKVLGRYAGDEIILMGDFNTPRESVFFTELRKTMQHAFETAGSGFAETWPVPIPVLSLDHVWTSGQFTITGCKLGWWLVSDHRPVIVELTR